MKFKVEYAVDRVVHPALDPRMVPERTVNTAPKEVTCDGFLHIEAPNAGAAIVEFLKVERRAYGLTATPV